MKVSFNSQAVVYKQNNSKNKNISINNEQDSQEKKGKHGTLKALGVLNALSIVPVPLTLLSIEGLKGANKNLATESKCSIKKAVNTILDSKGLKECGVKLNDYRSAGLNLTGVPDKLLEMINPVFATAQGSNAFYGTKKGARVGTERLFKNEVACNMEKLPTAVFHELGHAFNANKSKFWSGVQKLRTPALLISSGLALFCALTKEAKPKEENNNELTKGQKAKNFVRNNSGKLAVLAMLPVVAEEAMATIRGNGWAKEFLNKDLAKKVAKGNAFGLATYALTAAAVGLAAVATRKAKDGTLFKKKN